MAHQTRILLFDLPGIFSNFKNGLNLDNFSKIAYKILKLKPS